MDISAFFLKKLIDDAEASAPPKQADYRPACVFLLFFDLKNPCILAIQKTDTKGYPWRNQVALPGGHVDEEDGSRLAAAFRELEEEVNILPDSVALMGSLGHFQTVLQRDVEVFVGIWDETSDIAYEEAEIARMLPIPLEILVKTHLKKNFMNRIPDVDELQYPVDGARVWGLTARIFHYLIELLIPHLEK